MEELYPPNNYGASERFNLKLYFDQCQTILPKNTNQVEDNNENRDNETSLNNIAKLMDDVPLEALQSLSDLCEISLLSCSIENSEDYPMAVPKNINSSTKLPTPFINRTYRGNMHVNTCREEYEDQISFEDASLLSKRLYKNNLDFKIPTLPPDLMPGSDIVLSIFIYKPFSLKYFSSRNSSEKLRFQYEILALGSNTLIDLREAIACKSDEKLCREAQSTSDNLHPIMDARKKFPSYCFFIDNVFYNDLRQPHSTDYSIPLMKWAKENKIKDIQSRNIENVTLQNLTPRFGYPYLFLHQGECEHIVVFSDVSLLRADDCLHSECYPHRLKTNMKGNKLCSICLATSATWLCLDNDRLPQRRVFLCTNCCNSYNYLDEKKIGNFKLYPYQEI